MKSISYWLDTFFSEPFRHKAEKIIVYIAILSFAVHLGLVLLSYFQLIEVAESNQLLKSPISAIYTPFSFILIYEVYLLIYYLPKSISTYIGKQYEIISLILIRRIFKDISLLDFGSEWFENKYDLAFTYDVLTTLLLFLLIFLFYRLNKKRPDEEGIRDRESLHNFIQRKYLIAKVLLPIFFALALYSFARWMYESIFSFSQMLESIKDVNNIFFDEFFTVLILTDLLLLLISLLYTDQFEVVIRNSGFIISTILIRLSFGVEGLGNRVLILAAVGFGVLINAIFNLYKEKLV